MNIFTSNGIDFIKGPKTTSSVVNQPFSVTFDSNVIECVVSEDKAKHNGLSKIFYALREGVISGYVTYSYFVHDTFKKDARVRINTLSDGVEIHIPSNPLLYSKGLGMKVVQMATVPPDSYHCETAMALTLLNMKVLAFGRRHWPATTLSLPICEIPTDYDDRVNKARGIIEDQLHCGFYRFREYMRNKVGKDCNDFSLLFQLKNVKLGRAFNRAFAEAADGDALIAHYGYNIDFFCTKDEASDAGPYAIFSQQHREILLERLGMKIISPQELIEILEGKESGNG